MLRSIQTGFQGHTYVINYTCENFSQKKKIYIYNMLLCIIWSRGSDTYYYGVVLVLYARGLLEPERTVEACFSVGLPIQWLLLLLNEIFSKLSGIYHFSEHVSSYNVSNAGVVSAGINELVEHNHDLPLRVGVRKPQ